MKLTFEEIAEKHGLTTCKNNINYPKEFIQCNSPQQFLDVVKDCLENNMGWIYEIGQSVYRYSPNLPYNDTVNEDFKYCIDNSCFVLKSIHKDKTVMVADYLTCKLFAIEHGEYNYSLCTEKMLGNDS